jgi:hypothetical protein
MTCADTATLRAPTLVEFTVCIDGARMSCHYCRDDALLSGSDVNVQILLFQELHFECDPHTTTAQVRRTAGG